MGRSGLFMENLLFLASLPTSLPKWCYSVLSLWDPMDCTLPGSSVHGILQARILEWIAMHSSKGSSQSRVEPTSPTSSALAGGFFTTSATWEALVSLYGSLKPIL